MTPFLFYQLKAGLCIMVFTTLYYVLFRKETFHVFNRIYLLCSITLSAIMPAIQLPGFSTNEPILMNNFIGAATIYANQVNARLFAPTIGRIGGFGETVGKPGKSATRRTNYNGRRVHIHQNCAARYTRG